MEAVLTVISKVAVMLILIVVGYLVTKKGMLTERGASEITTLLIQIVTPCLIVNSFLTSEDSLSAESCAPDERLRVVTLTRIEQRA